MRRNGLLDSRGGYVEDACLPGRPRAARRLDDERDRVRLEVEPVLSRGLVGLRRVCEEPAVVEDLVEVPDERASVPEVHQLPLELADECLRLRDPLLPMTADPVQLPLRREPQAFCDQEELLWTTSPAEDELVHSALRGVHEGRRGPVNGVPRRQQAPPP